MPTSDISSVPAIINEVWRLQPKSVLDLGAGAGKFGCLIREYLDVAQGRYDCRDWQVRIDAVEGFEPYVNLLHYAVYDSVLIEPFKLNNAYKDYDLVLMVDSLEHLPREVGSELLSQLRADNKNVLVSVPWGQNYHEQGSVNGNELERHRAHWQPLDFQMLGGIKIYHGVCAVYRLPRRS